MYTSLASSLPSALDSGGKLSSTSLQYWGQVSRWHCWRQSELTSGGKARSQIPPFRSEERLTSHESSLHGLLHAWFSLRTEMLQKSLQVVLGSEMREAMGSFEVHSDSKPNRQAEKQTWPCSKQDERAANNQTLHVHNWPCCGTCTMPHLLPLVAAGRFCVNVVDQRRSSFWNTSCDLQARTRGDSYCTASYVYAK